MPPVARAPAHVVDRRSRRADELRKRRPLRSWRRDEYRPRPGRAERRAQLVARTHRERDDGDHHGVPRPDLHERLRRTARPHPDGRDQLVRFERVPLHTGDELLERQRAHAADRRAFDLGSLDLQRRQRVTGGRGGREVAAEGAAVADLRRADRPRRLGQRGQQLGELAGHRLGVGEPGAEAQRSVLARPASQLLDLVQVQQRLRASPVEVQRDHDVRPALDRQRAGVFGLQVQSIVERARREDVHGAELYGLFR